MTAPSSKRDANRRGQGRRRGNRPERSDRSAGAIAQPAWKPVTYHVAPTEILVPDAIERIHQAGLAILQEIGIKVLGQDARDAYAAAGFDVDDTSELVRFDSTGLMETLATIPAEFSLRARNPQKNLRIGGKHAAFCSVGGPAYCMDLEQGRRRGTYKEMCDFIRLVQSLDILHQEGGGGFEALDLPADTRHLDLFLAQATLMDKNWVPWNMGTEQTIDALTMGAMMMAESVETLAEKDPLFVGVVNTNSPLQLDIPMAEGLMTLAAHGQVAIITPFTLAGAMAPITLAGTLAQQHAEAMAGLALTQIIRPGVPAMYGAFSSNVDMRTGSPAFGTPEYTQAAQISGQLARRLGVPLRSSNTTAANAPDAQAAYESMMSLWGAMGGQANIIKHAAGWVGGGLTASYEKLIIDAEMLQMMAAQCEPPEVSDATLALDAIRDVGPAGHYFGTEHTLARYEDAFYTPLVSNWDNYETWLEGGSETAERKANRVWKQLLGEYEKPPIDAGIEEALNDFVARRKRGEAV